MGRRQTSYPPAPASFWSKPCVTEHYFLMLLGWALSCTWHLPGDMEEVPAQEVERWRQSAWAGGDMLLLHTCLKSAEPTPSWPPTKVLTDRSGVTHERCLTQHINVVGSLFSTMLQNHGQSFYGRYPTSGTGHINFLVRYRLWVHFCLYVELRVGTKARLTASVLHLGAVCTSVILRSQQCRRE